MITGDALREAIRECLEDPSPDARTCLKLASYYTILDHLPESPSGASGGPRSEFGILAYEMPVDDLIEAMDGLMRALEAKCPRLHDATMEKIRGKVRDAHIAHQNARGRTPE